MQRNYRFLSGIFLRTDMIEDIEMGRFQTRGVHYENLVGLLPSFLLTLTLPTPSSGQSQPSQSSLHPQPERQSARGHHLCSDEPRRVSSLSCLPILHGPHILETELQVRRTRLCGFRELGKSSSTKMALPLWIETHPIAARAFPLKIRGFLTKCKYPREGLI